MKYLAILGCLLLAGCQDDCLDNGGKWVVTGVFFTPVNYGNGITSLVPNYINTCQKPSK